MEEGTEPYSDGPTSDQVRRRVIDRQQDAIGYARQARTESTKYYGYATLMIRVTGEPHMKRNTSGVRKDEKGFTYVIINIVSTYAQLICVGQSIEDCLTFDITSLTQIDSCAKQDYCVATGSQS